jgi:hypothetical protein
MERFIDKIRVPVRVRTIGGNEIDGWMALAPQAPYHDGPETILELMNQPERVVPVLRAADGADTLIPRHAILWVEAGAKVDPAAIVPRSFSFAREERVQVHFEDGRRIEGVLQMTLPEDKNRASDYLNTDDDFFPLVVAGVYTILNKARVCEVRLFEASQLPAEMASGEA